MALARDGMTGGIEGAQKFRAISEFLYMILELMTWKYLTWVIRWGIVEMSIESLIAFLFH